MRKAGAIFIVALFALAFVGVTYAQSDIDMLRKELRSLQEKVSALEVMQKDPPQYITSYKGDLIKIGGKVEINYHDPQDSDSDPNPGFNEINGRARFMMDEIRLQAKVKASKNISAKIKVDFEADNEVNLDEAYMTIEDFAPYESVVQVGLQDPFYADALEYYTQTSPLARTAYWKYPFLGVQYFAKADPFYFRTFVTNGYVLDDKNVGKQSGDVNGILADGNTMDADVGNINTDNHFDFSVGLGYHNYLGELGDIDLLVWGYFGKVSNTDIDAWLDGTVFIDRPEESGDFIQGSQTKRRLGVNLAYAKDALEFYAQYIRSQDSYLRRYAWTLQTNYRVDVGMKYLDAVMPLYRYSYYGVGERANVGSVALDEYPQSWNRIQHTIALQNFITDKVMLSLEYNINKEKTGGDEPRNNEFLAQLRYKF
ncbi:MAG: hypothetical protein ABH872_04745 [Candidatus Omnitrophota bacterium]